MRLLLVNFEMDADSPVLAWQQAVASKLASRCNHITVITQLVGRCNTPENVSIHQIPYLLQRLPLRALKAKWCMLPYVYMLCRRVQYDVCFFHMAHEWAYRFAPALRHLRIPSLLWYAHGTVTKRLQLALDAVDRVVTSTPEGFRIASDKVRVIGQAIDTQLFAPQKVAAGKRTVLYVGRISARKRIDLIIQSFAELHSMPKGGGLKLKLVGPVLTAADRLYANELQTSVQSLGLSDVVEIVGPVSQQDLPALYAETLVHINLSETGSMDKTVMESLSCGCPVLTSNEAVAPLLQPIYPHLVLTDCTPVAIAKKVLDVANGSVSWTADGLRALVVGQHDMDSYVDRVWRELHELSRARS